MRTRHLDIETDAVAAEKERTRLGRLAAAIMAAIRKLVRFIFTGSWGEPQAGVRRRKGVVSKAGAVAGAAADHALIAAGKAMEGPGKVLDAAAGAVGSTLGALLPTPIVGPRQVADAAVAADRIPTAPPTFSAHVAPTELTGCSDEDAEIVQQWARALRKDDVAAIGSLPRVDALVGAWLTSLTTEQLLRVEQLPASRIRSHLLASHDADRTPLLPPASGILRLDAGPSPNERLASWGIAPEDRPSILFSARAKRPDREEVYEHRPVFAL